MTSRDGGAATPLRHLYETSTPWMGEGWQVEQIGSRLLFRFHGDLSELEGERSANALLTHITGTEEVDLVFEVSQMTGFAIGAQSAWRRAFMRRRRSIRSLATVGANPLVRMGATVLGLAIGVLVEHS
tara:strand:+ start:1995 stop:2378 length:384 start_codon:yes stop_codon:yes gene_type:complete